ncbi:MAG: CoA transferase [Chloroflexi bacterium]|nr:CoA transferase [Chloroflexota bacterium]
MSRTDELDALIGAWTRERTAEDVMTTLQHQGVPAGVVQNSEDLLERDPQMRHRGFYAATDHPEAGRIHHDGHPFRFTTIEHAPQRTPPILGEHTPWLLHDLLAMPDDEVNVLAAGEALA